MDIFTKILTDASLLGAVFSTIFIIFIGYIARRKNIVSENASKVLSAILLNLTLPFLAFNAFMSDINAKTFTTGLSVFAFGFIAYIILIGISFVLFAGYKGDKKDTLRILMIFGSTTFFGLPIINAILPAGTLYANLFNIAYRVFLYSYGLIVMSGAKFDKKNLKTIFLNPIIIATFVGFVLWMLQNTGIPQIAVEGTKQVAENGAVVSKTISTNFAFYRIDKTLPWVFTGFKYLGDLSSPLAWLAIGMTLASISLKDAVKDASVWIYSAIKTIAVPAIFIVIMLAFNFIGKSFGFNLSYEAIFPIVIMLATPPATVAVAYAINYDKESVFASNASLLTTVVSVFVIILWIIALGVFKGMGMF